MSNVKLRSSNGEDFLVRKAAALQYSEKIKAVIANLPATLDVVPLVTVTSHVLQKVTDYCNTKSAMGGEGAEKESGWEARFVQDMDLLSLYDLAVAATDLGIPDLFDLAYESLGERVRSAEELGVSYKVQDDVFFHSNCPSEILE
ncbi:hypothetical protein H6P81_013934 [Aristolochia fimbriata]|uniref:SKP1 component POZ domain-containing protein n=1 Tax=Aristolochia fimbriata TaxID=158543 RepID=A0AAV7EIY2_ARIFI|nr:hypothetical protein H6P81_013934 [Aristolochia fimbriata]